MFPKPIRFQLRQESDFFKTAKRKNFPFFQVMYQDSDKTEFAVIVPKKVSLKSSQRHKLLRQMRNILIESQDKFVKKQVVVVMFHSSLGKTFEELSQAVAKATDQLK